MSPLETDRFVEIMGSMFLRPNDEYWGPIYGPGGPRIHGEPEIFAAHALIAQADALELASPGLGTSFLDRVAEEPEDCCGTRPPVVIWKPGGPIGPGEPEPEPEPEPFDRAVLGAAIVVLSKNAGADEVGGLAREIGVKLIG
jgi:hypothetical protein